MVTSLGITTHRKSMIYIHDILIYFIKLSEIYALLSSPILFHRKKAGTKSVI